MVFNVVSICKNDILQKLYTIISSINEKKTITTLIISDKHKLVFENAKKIDKQIFSIDKVYEINTLSLIYYGNIYPTITTLNKYFKQIFFNENVTIECNKTLLVVDMLLINKYEDIINSIVAKKIKNKNNIEILFFNYDHKSNRHNDIFYKIRSIMNTNIVLLDIDDESSIYQQKITKIL